MSNKENDKSAILEIADNAVVAHAKAVLADSSADERLTVPQRVLLGAVPVEFSDQSLLHVPRELSQCAKGAGREDVPHGGIRVPGDA